MEEIVVLYHFLFSSFEHISYPKLVNKKWYKKKIHAKSMLYSRIFLYTNNSSRIFWLANNHLF